MTRRRGWPSLAGRRRESGADEVAGVVRVAAPHQFEVAGLARFEVEDGALVVCGGNDEEGGVLDRGGHAHVEMRRAGFGVGDFLFDDGDLVGEVGGRGLFLLQFVALFFEGGDGLAGFFTGSQNSSPIVGRSAWRTLAKTPAMP